MAQGEARGISGIRETGRWFRSDRVIDKEDKEGEGEGENGVLISFNVGAGWEGRDDKIEEKE